MKAIIFDIGSVLVSFNYPDFLKHLGYSEAVQKELDVIKEGGPFWQKMDRGLMTEEEGLKIYLDMIPTYKKEAEYAFTHMAYYMEEITPTSRFLRAAKAKGYQVYYLSNYSHRNWEIIFERFDFFRLFDGGVVSYQVHQVKPDAEIYQTLLGKYGLAPENTLFIDDRENNIRAAEKLGIHTLWLKPDTDLFAEAAELGFGV